jgi:hypothetical protein
VNARRFGMRRFDLPLWAGTLVTVFTREAQGRRGVARAAPAATPAPPVIDPPLALELAVVAMTDEEKT